MSTSRSHTRRSKRTFMQRLAARKNLLIPTALVLVAGLGAGAYHLTRGHATPEERIATAKQLESTGDRKSAVIEIKNALQQQPDNGEARFLLGRIQFANNEFADAEKELRQALAKGYQSPDASILLARTLLLLRQPKKVLDEIDVLPGANADANATILALRAQAFAMSGDNENLEHSLRQADDLVRDHPDSLAVKAGKAYASGETVQALALVDSAVAKAEGRVDLLLMKADLLRALKRYDEAFATYGKVLEREPSNIPARLAVAQQYLTAANLDKAQAELKALNTYAPNNLMGRYLEGLIEFRQKNLDAANNKLQEVLRSAPGFAPANLLVGAINLSQGKRENAITHLNRVLEVAPNHVLARKLLASAMLESGQAERARELIADIKNDDGDVQLLSLQGNIALRQGAYQEARKKLEKAAALAPDNTALIRELAASRMASGDESGAVQSLTELAERDNTQNQADVLLVMTHARAKRYGEALKAIDALERRHPRLPLAENLRGIIYQLQNDTARAAQYFAKALEIDAAYFPAASNLARLDLMKKDINSARSRFQKVLKKDPNNARALVALAELAALDKNEAEFLSMLDQAKKAEPKDARPRVMLVRYWLAKRDAGKALIEARSALDITGNSEFLGMMGTAQLLQNDAASAVANFGKWAEASPTNPIAFYRLGQAQAKTNDNAGALKSMDKALALQPRFSEAGLSKAILLSKIGRAEEGLKLAREIQTQYPKQAAGYLVEADILYNAKKYPDAARLYVKSAQLAGQGQFLLQAMRSYNVAGQPAEAERTLSQWIEAHPADLPVRHALAQTLLNTKHHAEAIKHYQILVKANPKDLIALNNLAWLHGQTNPAEGLKSAEEAYKIAPGNPAVLDTLGWLLTQTGQAKRALPHLQAALKQTADNTEIRWHLALALEQAGNKREAAAEIDRLLTSGKEFPQLQQARDKLRELRGSAR